ncbi:MAG: 4Fe-4S binding protein [Promethearchaeota archaeon]
MPEKYRPIQVEMGLCVNCERCVKACPAGAIEFKGNVRTIDYKKCRGCLACINACPKNAIIVDIFEVGNVISIDTNPEKCDGCGICSEKCPNSLYEPFKYKKGLEIRTIYRVYPKNFSKCKGCETCVENCPNQAISIQRI